MKALNIRLVSYGKKHAEVAESYRELASFYRKVRRYDKAVQYYLAAVRNWLDVTGYDEGAVGDGCYNLAHLFWKQKDLVSNEKFLKKAKMVYRKDWDKNLGNLEDVSIDLRANEEKRVLVELNHQFDI